MKISNEAVLREILEQSLAGYWDWDIPSGDEYLSPTFKKMFGYEDHEIPNRADSWQKLIFPEDLPGVLESCARHFQSKGAIPYCNEVRYRHKNGSTVWVICTGRVVEWDQSGSPVRMVGCHVDITRQKETEATLQKNGKLYALAERLTRCGYWAYDPAANESECSDGLLDVLRMTRSEFSQASAMKIVHPDDLHLVTDFQRNAAEHGAPWDVEHRLLFPDGSIAWTRSYGVVIPRGDGLPPLLYGANQDITERKMAEQALRESEERFSQSAEQSRTVTWEVDADGLYTYVSPVIERVFGFKPEEVVGRCRFYDLHPEDGREAFKAAALETFRRKAKFEALENPIRTKGGGLVWVLTSGVPLLHADGSLRGYRGNDTDISERKRSEAALQNAQKLEFLGHLAGGIAHDFNNLLGGIFGNIELAARKTEGTDAAQYLATALSTIDRARALTGQLLPFAGGGAPVKRLERLSPFIKETARFALSGSNVRCSFSIPADVWQCEVDRNQIAQVVDNIVINAQQAMPEGGTIEIGAENLRLAEKSHAALPAGDYVRITFTDHGIGMPKEVLPKIFDPFFTTKARGHGLGLATCYSILKRHGGCIDVESEPGRGSTFTVYLPASPEAPSRGTAKPAAVHKGSGSILVMDDEGVIRDAVRYMLESMGYTVHCVSGSHEAIELFGKKREGRESFVALILDLTIPGGPGGRETLGEIRRIDRDIPAFVASGYADDPVVAHPTQYGFNGSISKPFRIAELAELLNSHLGKAE